MRAIRGKRTSSGVALDPGNCYELLGLTRSATSTEIRHAYYRKAKELHPDKGGGKEGFQALCSAFETLSDQVKRQEYHQALFERDCADGLAPYATSAKLSGHILSEHPEELVRILLIATETQWNQVLTNMRQQQLERLLACLQKVVEGGGSKHRHPRNSNKSDEIGTDLRKLAHLNARGNGFEASLLMCKFHLVTPATTSRVVAVFYHSAVVELKRLLSEQMREAAMSPFKETMKRAMERLAAAGLTCPFHFRQYFAGKNPSPFVDDLDLALEMREQGLQDGLSAEDWKALRSRWTQQAKASCKKNEKSRELKAAVLIGYLSAVQKRQREVPLAMVRRRGKQRRDMVLQVPLHGKLALRLGQPATKLVEHLASGAGQAALLNFLSACVAPLKDGPGGLQFKEILWLQICERNRSVKLTQTVLVHTGPISYSVTGTLR